MKALVTLIALVSMAQVSAKEVATLESGDAGLYNVEASIMKVEEACPADSHIRCIRGGQTVTLKVPLHGCLDRLAGHFTNLSYENDKTIIHFSGVAVATKKSQTARCMAVPTEYVKVIVPTTGKVEVKNLANTSEAKSLNSQDKNLTTATAVVESFSPRCPAPKPGRMGCMAIGGTVTLRVSLNGCLDRLGHYATSIEFIDGEPVIQFAGVNVGTKASLTAFCIKAPTETVQVAVPFNGKVKVLNLGFQAK